MTVYRWSQTAANNDDIDSTVNYQEGQSPGSLNNSGRAVMAAVAKWRDDMSGMLNSGGTDTAYTVTTNQVYTALTDGITVTMRMHATSGASPTLAPDGLTAKAITTDGTTAVPTGGLVEGGIYKFTYDAGTDKWIVEGDFSSYISSSISTAVSTAVPTGSIQDYLGTTAPSGFVLASGRTIGDASSAATERANADTFALFALLWGAYDNSILAVSGGRGSSAAADFSAHKTIMLPDLRGRVRAGKDNMGGSAASRITSGGCGITGATLGASGGAQVHTLTSDQLPQHTHSGSTNWSGTHTHPVKEGSAYSGGSGELMTSGDDYTHALAAWSTSGDGGNHQHGFTTDGGTGGGNSHNNTQPTWITNVIIKL